MHPAGTPNNPTAGSDSELALISSLFSGALAGGDVRTLLEHLNAPTIYRFTGIYRFAPGWVMSVALWDREHPEARTGPNVKLKESYCWLTSLGSCTYVIEDALADSRLDGHAAQAEVRSYAAVVLRDSQGKPWGTLCHFDLLPRAANPATIAYLERVRPLVEEMVVRD